MSHCLVLAGFFQGLLPPWSQSVLWNWVKKCTFEYYRKYEVKMTRMLFKFIIYPSCERTLNNGRVKSKIGNRLVMTWFYWLHMIIYEYFSSIFCIVPKKVLLLKYRKWVSHLKNRYHYAKGVENPRINFSISLYCTMLFSRKENFKFFEVALSAVLCNGTVGCIMNVWGYHHWNTANTTLDIYSVFENGHKSIQTRCKVCSNLAKSTTTIDFCLTSVFFIKLEHLSHPTLVLLFILWKGVNVGWKCAVNFLSKQYSDAKIHA